jgi:hypothetical protein
MVLREKPLSDQGIEGLRKGERRVSQQLRDSVLEMLQIRRYIASIL